MSGELNVQGVGTLISLRGTTSGIEVEETWHTAMVQTLREIGYQGAIYIPCRLGADLGDHDDALNKQEQKNNARAFEASAVQVFYQPENKRPQVEDLLPFAIEVARQSSAGKNSYVAGAYRPEELHFGNLEDKQFKVHQGIPETAKVAYRSLFPLRR